MRTAARPGVRRHCGSSRIHVLRSSSSSRRWPRPARVKQDAIPGGGVQCLVVPPAVTAKPSASRATTTRSTEGGDPTRQVTVKPSASARSSEHRSVSANSAAKRGSGSARSTIGAELIEPAITRNRGWKRSYEFSIAARTSVDAAHWDAIAPFPSRQRAVRNRYRMGRQCKIHVFPGRACTSENAAGSRR
jgi:hypothetical protein